MSVAEIGLVQKRRTGNEFLTLLLNVRDSKN